MFGVLALLSLVVSLDLMIKHGEYLYNTNADIGLVTFLKGFSDASFKSLVFCICVSTFPFLVIYLFFIELNRLYKKVNLAVVQNILVYMSFTLFFILFSLFVLTESQFSFFTALIGFFAVLLPFFLKLFKSEIERFDYKKHNIGDETNHNKID